MSANNNQAEFLVAASEKRLHTREESMSRISFGHENQRSNSKLEQLDILAAELIDSANAIDKPGEIPSEHQAPAIIKHAMREEELVSADTSIDYAASYYIEHSESWGEVNYGTAPVHRTNETMVVRETENKRNDSLEVQDVTDLELDTHLLQSGQSYIVEYESKSGLEEELKQTQPRRRIERRSDTVDIRKVAEERPMEELGYTIEEFTSANTTTTVTMEQPKQQKQQLQRRETNLEQVRSNGSRNLQEVNKSTYTTNTTWDGTFISEQPTQQLLTTTVMYEQPCGPDETDEIRQTKVTATEIEVRVEATRPTPTPRKLNTSTWDDSFIHENSQEMSQQNEIIVLGEDHVRESVKSARDSNENRDYFTSKIKNVDATQLNTSMVVQDVDKEQYEKINNFSNTQLPSPTSPIRYSLDQPKNVQAKPNLEQNGTESKKPETIRNDSTSIYTQKRLSETKTTKSLECMQLEITVCEPTNSSTPQEKSSRKNVPNSKNSPSKVPDFVTTITAKEQCICELCTCGRHRCPHNDFQDHLKISDEPLMTITSYKEEYDKKSVDREINYYNADHLHIEEEFIGERRHDYTATKDLSTSLDFLGISGENPSTERRNTYTKVEGEFIDTTKSKTECIDHDRTETIQITDRFKSKGPFERVEIIKRTDDIQLEDEKKISGISNDYTDTVICERTEVTEYENNLKMKNEIIDINIQHEKEINRTEQNSYNLIERRSPIKQTNNLKLEGEFDRPEKAPYRSGEKRSLIIQTNNLKLEGEFERPEKTPYEPSERRTPIKQIANLKSEGEFEKRIIEKAPMKGDRSNIKKPKDHLKPEGSFEGRPKDDYKPTKGERAEIIKHTDNLYMEGDIQICTSRDDYPNFVVGQRTQVTKHEDNLRIEGEFIDMETRDDYQVIMAERMDIIKHEDNLKLVGEINIPEKIPFKTGERRLPIKQTDNLKSEGEFEKRIIEKAPTKGDRAEIKKPKDHLKSEGPFEGRPKDDYKPTKGERAEIIKHTDNLYMEGDIQICTSRNDYTDFIVEERTEVTKHEDNLRMEGEFIDMETRDDYQVIMAERMDIIKHEDNLKLEGEINVPEKIPFQTGERRLPIKQTDNLKSEGEFEKRIIEKAPTKGDRAEIKKPKDHLKSEGPFEGRPKDDYKSTKGERAEIIKHTDNLYMEGDIQICTSRNDYTDFIVEERTEVTKHEDNLRMEGEFIDMETRDDYKVVKGERMEIIKHEDNLKLEGEINIPEKIPFKTGERRLPIKQTDNLKSEGEFEKRIIEKAPTKGDRAEIKKPKDHLKSEGPFEGRPKDDYKPTKGERAEIIKHTDNLYMEGDIQICTSRNDYTDFIVEERTEVTKHEDNLRMEGEFIDMETRDDYQVIMAERMDIIKHEDNLKLEGEINVPEKIPFQTGERRLPIKQTDNLKSEGEFEKRIIEKAPTKGDRAEIKKPKDHLKSEGPFEGRPKDDYKPTKGERAEIIKHTDNLYMEGDIQICTSRNDYTDFIVEERTEVTKHEDNLRMEGEFIDMETRDDYQVIMAERMDIIKHEDNLKLEGEINVPEKIPFQTGERRLPIKQTDNLKSEGEFEKRIIEKAPTKGDRAEIKKPKDHLKSEGPFEGRPKDDYKPTKGERAEIIKHTDNLYMEGDIQICTSRNDYTDFIVEERTEVTKHEDNLRMEGEFIDMETRDDYQVIMAERMDIIKHEDNLKLEGEINVPEKIPFQTGERRLPIKQTDNLKSEGEFEKRIIEKAPTKGDRAEIKKPKDHLKSEGPFEGRPKDDYKPTKGERAEIIKHTDNLYMEGDIQICTSRNDYTDFIVEERTEVTKHEDNLRMEGEFIDMETRDDYKVVKGERMEIIKHEDNLKLEGEINIPEKIPFKTGERRLPIKQTDNLKSEGEFEKRIIEKAPTKGDRAEIKKPKDHLKSEGPFEGRPKDDYKPTKGERAEIIKHTDNLYMEGDIQICTSRDDYPNFVVGQRTQVTKHEDNLHIEGEFIDMETRDDYKVIKGERMEIIKHEDNLKLEGNIERPEKITYSPIERRTPIKQMNNLKLEGEFDRPVPKEFIPAERPKQKKPSDNLHPEGEFDRQPKPKAPVKGERADVIRPQDNLKPEGDIARPEKTPYKPSERRSPIKQTNNLKLEGEFDRPVPTEFVPAERPKQKKPSDNLHPEGEFDRQPKPKAPVKGERADVKKPQDNLKPEGDIIRPEKTPYKPSERRTPIKQTNNLKLEGEFDRPVPIEFVPAERPKQKKPSDNLHPEGEFDRQPKPKAPVKGERADVKKPQDNLKPEGDIARPEKTPYKPSERRSPIKQTNNLKLEGEFDRPVPIEFIPAERPKQKKPSDNLHPEGEFDRQPKPKAPVKGERADVKRPQDNLKPEGEMDHPEKISYKPGEKVSLIKQSNNLKLEGEFNRPEKIPYKTTERRLPIKQVDNLKNEGEFEKRPTEKAPTRGDRAEVKKPQDHLKLEGSFECRAKNDYKSIKILERPMPIVPHDNLSPEKELDRTSKSHGFIKDKTENMKSTLVKHSIKSEDICTKSVADQCIINYQEESDLGIEMSKAQKSERRNAIRHSDLRNESDFEKTLRVDSTDKIMLKKSYDNVRSESETGNIHLLKNNNQHTSGDNYRTQSFKREDHLRMEGRFETHNSSDDYNQIKSVDRMHRRQDNLRIEEEFSDNYKKTMKHLENLKSNVEFMGRTKEDYIPRKVDKSDVIRQEDKLQMSGAFDGATCTKTSYTSVHGEHTEIRKHGYTVNEKTNEAHQQITQGEQLVSPSILNRIENNMKHSENKTTSSKTSIYREESSLKQRQEFEKQQEQLKHDYVNRKHSDTKQISIDETNRTASPTRTGHKRWNIISSKTDISNTALHRRIASAERERTSIREFDQVIESNSEKKNQSSLQRSVKDGGNPWASSSYERESRVVKSLPKDNLHVGGSFYHSSEAKSYGNFSNNDKVQRVEHMRVQGNVSHITLGDGRSSSAHSSSLYKKEFVSRQKGPCPAALLQADKAPFKHTRDTPRHKFYMPVVETN
ncbi:PREDICTED: titin [Ceratosolen solmsi marchali]|uniref:Titin n=1 Tax=Ceratosolen solmsi marchali TaxID=326594 RepID=A0AAJ6YS84_9HYME|nr:PREDICTED: titin [Ceratosolen solmsi marchali]